jgi:putative cardiolipin synthase
MKVHRTAQLTLSLLALLAVGVSAAAPPVDQPAADILPPSTIAPASGGQQVDQPAASQAADSTSAVKPTGPTATQWNQSSATVPIAPGPDAAQTASQEHAPSPAQNHQAPPAIAGKAASTTPQQAAAVAQVANPTGASGFRLMSLSNNALLSRVSLADQAKRSIDLQYYIFDNDATGRLIALHLLQAADRGVHVRILLDDLNLTDEVRMFAALASSPNIEVRLFNPFASAQPSAISKAAQILLHFSRLNRRMHNKCFIVDNDEAVIGGRNIGDGYFNDSADTNFRDLDVLAIGPVVPAATRAFEAYWNSQAAHPISEFHPTTNPAADLVALRPKLRSDARKFDQSAYAQQAADDLPNGASADHPGKWFWGPATLVADQPDKIAAESERASLLISPELKTLINGAQSEVLLISPYFIPSDVDEHNFIADAQRGVAFKVLTNSLASTDEVAVAAGYSKVRGALLAGGVQLYELKPAPGGATSATDAGRSSGVSLHAKAFVVDERYVFIGSLNMDQRSKLLNTEMGVIVDSPQLAKAVGDFFRSATSPANAYHVVLGAVDGSGAAGMHWETKKNGRAVDYSHEPNASLRRHLQEFVVKLLPIEGLL